MEAGDKVKSIPRNGSSAWIMILVVFGTSCLAFAFGYGAKSNKIDTLEASDVAFRLEYKKGCEDIQTLKEFVAAQKVLNEAMREKLNDIYVAVKRR
jgi:hypothetical protein